MSRVVLVGELNPYGSNPDMALYHWPRHASGNRLREHLGLRDVTYHGIDKVNLCTGKWSTPEALAAAVRILCGSHDVIVCLGRKVMTAFHARPEFFQHCRRGTKDLISLPHPSGLNRLWGVSGARDRAREVLRLAVPEVPWGESETSGRPGLVT